MNQVYLLRHQVLGLLTTSAYAQKPTDNEVERMRMELALVTGEKHPKTGAPYFLVVVPVPLAGDATQLDPYVEPEPETDPLETAGLGEITISAKGTVTNR